MTSLQSLVPFIAAAVLAAPSIGSAQNVGAENLKGKRIAILATDGFEESELFEPKKALEAAGAQTEVVSPTEGKIKAWDHDHWSKELPVDTLVSNADAAKFDGLLLPGGVMNPDKLRMDPASVKFVRDFVSASKPIAAICHGPWTLLEAGGVKGKKLTSWPSLQTDIKNAGGDWVDKEVVKDGKLVTSRKPADLPAFIREANQAFQQG
ncbi:MAG: type 1 glutamine amidotransferase domain-containing protein [Bdellovibrionota bacterium]